MKEALQKSSIEIEKWSNSIDALIDEEDIIAEQLKEYLYFSESLKVGLLNFNTQVFIFVLVMIYIVYF